jgi:hypothetical protein
MNSQACTLRIYIIWYTICSFDIKNAKLLFRGITDEGIIINTSFNLAGEPVVETPEDALKSFAIGGFDAIYLQGWLISKTGK